MNKRPTQEALAESDASTRTNKAVMIENALRVELQNLKGNPIAQESIAHYLQTADDHSKARLYDAIRGAK